MNRRNFLKAAAAVGVMAPGRVRAAAPGAWAGWTQTYLRDGRVVDWQQGAISHSEGQGYGLLLAQAEGDRARFDQIEHWTRSHLAQRRDSLMAWKWQPEKGVTDWHTATDGDLFRAWALLRAARDSGWAGHLETAIAIARDITALCLAPDPRAGAEWLLLPGAEARKTDDNVLFNPSYIMPRALRELGQAAGEPRLIRAADHGETVLAELAAKGHLPDWTDITAAGFAVPPAHDGGWGYDALRIPLYLAWSGGRDHPAVALALRRLREGATPGHLVVRAAPDGQIRTQSDRPGFHALAAVAECSPLPHQPVQARDYYPDTLLMLSQVALREGGCVL
ncbi:MAG: glycosyl hydrolase family 8 [Paracoccus sp. (in: a-proteobacteria)]